MSRKIKRPHSYFPAPNEILSPSSMENYCLHKKHRPKYSVPSTSHASGRAEGGSEVDSLRSLRNRNKHNDIDDKIKYLRTELTSLVGDPYKSDPGSYNYDNSGRGHMCNMSNSDPRFNVNYDYSTSHTKSYSLNFDYPTLNRNYEANAGMGGNQEFAVNSQGVGTNRMMNYPKPEFSPVTSDFSEWLSSTIDSISEAVTSDSTRNKHYATGNNFAMNKNTVPVHQSSVIPSNYFPQMQDCYVSLTSQHNPESLLYESFLMQNFDMYVSSSDESVSEVAVFPINLSKKRKQKSDKIRNPHARRHKNPHKKRNVEHKKEKKHKKMTRKIHQSSDSDVEVINIDESPFSSGYYNNSKTNKRNVGNNNLRPNPTILNPSHYPSTSQSNPEHGFRPYANESTVDWHDQEQLTPNNLSQINSLTECSKSKELIENKQIKCEQEKGGSDESGSKKRVWECPICFEQSTGQEVVTTMCGHIFCKHCLVNYYSTSSQSCPSCRTNLHDKPFITLFNF